MEMQKRIHCITRI